MVGVVSVVRDVGEHILTNARLAEAHSRFAGAFDAASTGMAIVASDGRFLAVNAALCGLLARDADTLLGDSLATVTHPEDLVAARERSGRAFKGEVESCQHPQRFLLPDGGIVWGLLTMTIVRDASGVLLYFVARSRTSAIERRLRASCADTRRSSRRSPSRIR